MRGMIKVARVHIRRLVKQVADYPSLTYTERQLLLRRLLALPFLAAFPLFLAWGAARATCRTLTSGSGLRIRGLSKNGAGPEN
jgi:hypothetical protein